MCERVPLPGGGVAIVCGGHGRGRHRSCVHCGAAATRLCDHRNSNGRTCDAALCARCAARAGKNLDYCRFHARQHPVSAALPFEEGTDGRS